MTPLIMLPGMMCDERLFAPQVDALSFDREVQVAELSSYSTIHDLAAEVIKTAPPKFALAGLSMGGIVAMEICAQAPTRVEKLALMDTNPKAELEEVKQQRELQIRDVISGNLRKVMRDEMKPNYLADTSNKQAILNTCMEMALSLGADVFVKQSQALRDRHDQQETLRGLDIPVLVLCGSEDRLCSLEQHQLIHKLIPNSWLEVVMDAGHLPTLEQPEKTTEILKTWLKN